MVFATHRQRAARPNSARQPGTVRKVLKMRPMGSQDDSGWPRTDSGWLRTAQDELRMAQDGPEATQDSHVPGSFLLSSCHVLSHPESILSHPESSWDILRKRTFCDRGRAHRPDW